MYRAFKTQYQISKVFTRIVWGKIANSQLGKESLKKTEQFGIVSQSGDPPLLWDCPKQNFFWSEST